MGTSRVSPLKQITIPRLELTAAAVAVKMDKVLRQELQIPLRQSVFWTDSTTVLNYIGNESARFKTFVANRVSQIRDATTSLQWRFVKSSQNPADQATRGLKAKDFVQAETWMKGHNFLLKPEEEWPQRPDQMSQVPEQDPEIKGEIKVNVLNVSESNDIMSKLTGYYSGWFQLKRATEWMLRFKEILLQLCKARKQLQSSIHQRKTQKNKQPFYRIKCKNTDQQ